VADVGDTVGDDRGELEQRAEAAAPGNAERRADADRRVRLRPCRRGAVHRPLQPGLVEAGDHPPAALERQPEGTPLVAAGAYGHDQRPLPPPPEDSLAL